MEMVNLLLRDGTPMSDVGWVAVGTAIALLVGWYFYQEYQVKALLERSNIPYIGNTAQGNPLPWLGHVPTFLQWRPWDVLMEWHTRVAQSPILAYPLFGNTMYCIASPELLKQTLQSKIAHVKKDTANVMKPFLSILGTGIVTSEDESWLKQRLKMSHPLRKDVLEIIPRQTVIAVQRFCDTIDSCCQADDDGTTAIPLGSSLRHLTLQVISGSFLSLSAEESDSTFAKMYLPIVEEANSRVWHPYRAYCFFLPAFWSYHLNVYRLNRYVSQLIRKRWAQRKQEQQCNNKAGNDNTNDNNNINHHHHSRPLDMLDRVLQAYEKECPPHQMDISSAAVRQIRDEMKTFMLAGHETSAAMMTWALYELLQNDELCDQVRAEAQAVFGVDTDIQSIQTSSTSTTTTVSAAASNKNSTNDGTKNTMEIPENLSELVCSEACLKESLRKYNVVPLVARRIVQDLYLQDQGKEYFIPAGSPLQVHLQAIHRNPDIWPDPLKFDPSRFLQKDHPPAPFTFVPFIAGPRNCLGQHLALLESKMVISMLLQRYKFKLTEETKAMGVDPRHRYMVPVIPKDEVMVQVVGRPYKK